MNVGLACSRWLGLRCLEELALRRTDIDLAGVAWEPKARLYPGDPTVEEAHARARHLRMPVLPLAELLASSRLVLTMLCSHIYTTDELRGRLIVNLHPAPLPEYRGCNSYSWAIENGDPYYAVSMHMVDAGIDTGPLIGQRWLPILPDDTAWTLYQRAQCAALDLFRDRLVDLLTGVFADELPQDETRARYYRRDRIPPMGERLERAWDFPA